MNLKIPMAREENFSSFDFFCIGLWVREKANVLKCGIAKTPKAKKCGGVKI
jgi:hypothetical protein